MRAEIKSLILEALHQYAGDNLERAECAWGGLNQEEMQMQHGQSGRTRQETIDGYRSHRKEVDEAIAVVGGLK